MKNRYRHELWFQEKAECQFISTKDILKLLVINPLQKLLVMKSSYRISFAPVQYYQYFETITGFE